MSENLGSFCIRSWRGTFSNAFAKSKTRAWIVLPSSTLFVILWCVVFFCEIRLDDCIGHYLMNDDEDFKKIDFMKFGLQMKCATLMMKHGMKKKVVESGIIAITSYY